MNKHRVHPYTIFEYLSRFLFVIIIPLIQQVIFLSYNITEIINTLSINILSVGVLIFLCILEYRANIYRAGQKYFYLKKGLFQKRIISLPYNRIQFINIQRSLIPSIFGAAKLSLDAATKDPTAPDISINLSKSALLKAAKPLFPKKDLHYVYKADILKLIITAASWSNPATGLLLSVPFINNFGKVLSAELNKNLYETVNIGIKFLAIGLPPAAAWIAYIMLAGWVVAFSFMLLRYINFKVFKSKDNVLITRGLISRVTQIIDTQNINAILLKQTLIMKIFKLYTAYINVIGIGKEKGEQRMLIAASLKQDLKILLDELLSLNTKSTDGIKPPKKAFFSYIRTPLIYISTLLVVLFLLAIKFKMYIKIIIFISLFMFLLLIWWLIIRILGYKHAKLSISQESIFINGYKHLSLLSSIISLNKVQYIQITQNPLQRHVSLANVKIYFYSERSDFFKIRQLPISDVENFVEMFENSN